MPGSAAKVVISERQQEVLRQLSTATTAAKRLTQRATIVLLAFAGLDNEAIAPRVGLERHQVGLWRRRWQQAFAKLVTIECLETAATLRRAIEEVLSDEPRSSPGGPLPTGRLTSWPTRPANAASWSRSPPRKWAATCARRSCSRTAAATG